MLVSRLREIVFHLDGMERDFGLLIKRQAGWRGIMAIRLTDAERAAALEGLPQWRYDQGTNALRREFGFKDFSQAFGFMTRVALLAQEAGHHPDWSNSYNRVTISLSTHDAGGVTRNDTELAAAIDKLA
jgi:4a-hydroxytetrahydrobiopterin dehydratase